MMARTVYSLRPVWLAVLTIMLLPVTAFSASLEMMTTGGCACCHAWARHLREAGQEVVVKDLAMGQLMKMKLDAGIPAALAACHTARVEGYLIEGHVPEREIRRLLDERPEALGLVVPGMPVGSPGMESGSKREPYEVLLLKKDGSTEVFARYDAQSE
ncbi:MAG: DUF411 domain-containing protein [Hyphomicrobium sp.]|jgi:hypothetical protein|uniref:DUF411 domain-containing protein n=1 Tax=Hyphomicrobium sp. TaxID=82 RepID=UPI0025C51262|nr:DUF411 domain-containing protein [Hyphomicrobium sp.]MBX9865124.1 DUF411 domain-containing protein [Hyphomicrobium sp.]